jgi:regulator of chromosome condensation (RCC1) repeat-containing protein
VSMPLPGPASAVDGTLAFGCAVLESHAVYCWGDNAWGQLGAGSHAERSGVPLRAIGLDDATSVAVGEVHACATRVGGAVACWGSNWAGQCGNDLEYASAVRHLVVPTDVAGLGGVEQVSASRHATCSLGTGGVACWGAILQTPEGLERALDRTRPTPLAALSAARSIELGDDCGCALLGDDRVGCFGVGPHGCPSLDPLVGVTPLFGSRRLQRLVVGEAGACAAAEQEGWYCWQHPIEPVAADGPAPVAYMPRAPQPAPFALTDVVAYGHEACALGTASLRCLERSEDLKDGPALRERALE